MKHFPVLVFLTFCCVLSVSGCKEVQQSEPLLNVEPIGSDIDVRKQTVLDMYKVWNKAVEAGDRDGYLALLHDDIVMIPQAAEDIVGIDAYGEFLIPVFENASYEIEPLTGWDVEFITENIAQVRYDYIVRIKMKHDVDIITDSEAALAGLSNNLKYNDVLMRDLEGNWKVRSHMWNAGYERD